ncbi:MFS transporter, partial [Leucobacter sp. M11]|uniref:MFS transporter n=1 Tax=Leucobacter sp. M11 TaxID=2993565 RepID=UPI002D7F346D
MTSSYAALLRTPGAIPLTAAGLVARMPLSMIGIGLITMVSSARGSYALAGALAAVFALSAAIAGPQVARLADRWGQRRVIPAAALLSAGSLAGLLLSFRLGGPDAALFLFALGAGVAPSAPALVRVRWVGLLRGRPELHAAFAWEAVLDDLSFVLGPPLAIGLSVAWFPEAGPLVGGVLLLLGSLWLLAQRGSEPGISACGDGPRGGRSSALRHRTVWGVALIMVAMGAIIGTVDVASVAFAQQQGSPGQAAVVLAVYSIASAISGVLFGALRLRRATRSLLRVGIVGTAVTTVPLLWVGSTAGLAGAVLVAGVFFAPTMILATKLIEEEVPTSALTESLAWATAGLVTGTAVGPALAGPLIDQSGAGGGFAVSIVSGAALVALLAVTRA